MTAPARQKKTSPSDWHPAEIIAALRIAGWSLRQLALINGYSNPNSLTSALRRPYPRAERIIADAIGQAPQAIWPERYDANGQPNRGPGGMRPLRPANAQPSSPVASRNIQPQAVA